MSYFLQGVGRTTFDFDIIINTWVWIIFTCCLCPVLDGISHFQVHFPGSIYHLKSTKIIPTEMSSSQKIKNVYVSLSKHNKMLDKVCLADLDLMSLLVQLRKYF